MRKPADRRTGKEERLGEAILGTGCPRDLQRTWWGRPQGDAPRKQRTSGTSASPIVEAIAVGGITKEANTEEKGRCRH